MTPTTKPPELNPNLVLPVGTRIVTRVEVKTDASRALRPPEKATLEDADVALHESEVARLRRVLEDAGAASSLAEEPTAKEALHDLLLRIRLRKP